VIAAVAAARVIPARSGTETFAGALEATKFTGDPALPAGPSPMTLPAATGLLDWTIPFPTTRPARVIAAVAAVCVIPTTFGTEALAGPLETILRYT
jgi:hypothetical protein